MSPAKKPTRKPMTRKKSPVTPADEKAAAETTKAIEDVVAAAKTSKQPEPPAEEPPAEEPPEPRKLSLKEMVQQDEKQRETKCIQRVMAVFEQHDCAPHISVLMDTDGTKFQLAAKAR